MWVLRQDILGHFRPLSYIFGAKVLFKDTFVFEGRGCIPPPPLDAPLPRHNNHTDVKRCIYKAFSYSFDPLRRDPAFCDYRVSCTEMLFKIKHTIRNYDATSTGPAFYFHFDSKIITNITEIPTYPPEKFVTDIGGWLGLFSGTSILSFLEIFLFGILSLTAAYRKLKNHITTRRLQINPSHAWQM